MKYTRIVVTSYGGPDALQVLQEECPEPKGGEVRVRMLAAGVALPDLMMREGVHPETPRLPFTPGWDLVGVVDRLGGGVSGIEPGQIVAALPITGAYAEFVCLPLRELVPVPSRLDAAEAVSLVLNYVTAYQMLHRAAKVRSGQRVLIHGAAGGVGSALLQLGRLAGLEMYGTCSSQGASAVSDLGGVPIDYHDRDFVNEIHRFTSVGVDVVFDGIRGSHIWRSRKALRPAGKVVAYGLTSSLHGGRLASGRPGRRHRFRGIAIFGVYIAGGWLLPGRKRVLPYSIQWLKRLRPAWFREDLSALLELLKQQRIKPLIAQRFSLAEARQAHELLAKGRHHRQDRARVQKVVARIRSDVTTAQAAAALAMWWGISATVAEAPPQRSLPLAFANSRRHSRLSFGTKIAARINNRRHDQWITATVPS